ncbi:PREDICTED: melanoma-associated antigen 11-like [Dipodomys ordii]|uniref:Melanoma-associated antigen 11-like n=1 Tax=Dipodomys ordii TaxID=10020 RepID=A0A1S3G288_DIPOR|nr:PREDICTED: melanoma-associated antigen 11-like [Dipodomys ordii]
MPYTQRTKHPELEQVPQDQNEVAGPVGDQIPQVEEASMCLMPPTRRDMSEGLLGEVVRETNEEEHRSSDQAREELPLHDEKTLHSILRKGATSLIPFLLSKYWSSQTVSRIDMLNHIRRGHRRYFSQIFEKASVLMQLLFGLDIREVDPILHIYVLYVAAGITYNGMLSDVQGLPKSGLLIIVLCIIFMEGNRATDDDIWHVLSNMEVYPDREHFIYGNPRKLLMEDFVWEQYLEYQQVPGSDPIIYEFTWGPRAYAETSKMKVLEHWAKFSKVDPRSFEFLYEEALQEEQGASGHAMASSVEE